jgi:hypothetical protein
VPGTCLAPKAFRSLIRVLERVQAENVQEID